MDYYTHEKAIVESSRIGSGTRIWAFVHVLAGATIGCECNICDNVFIENDVVIGDRVTIKCGVQVWDGVTIEDDVFVGPNATFTNDLFPRSKHYPEKYSRTTIKKGASIGANATILPGLIIGRNCMVGAGAVVTRNVPPNAIVTGNPARIRGYTDTINTQIAKPPETEGKASRYPLNIGGVEIFELSSHSDMRGQVVVAQHPDTLPFVPKRCFFVINVPSKDVRGEHAHRKLHQFLVCIHGTCAIVVDDGKNRTEVVLDSPNRGLYIPPMVWGIQYKFSENAVLAVMASDVYETEEYIRDYDEFLNSLG